MPTIRQLSVYSQTALASYAINLEPGGNNTSAYVADKVKMAVAQATEFNAAWDVLQQSTSTINGFSAVLLQNRTTGEKVLAIAGTDSASPADWAADLGVFLNGSVANMDQYMALESFYSQLVTGNKLAAGEQITVTGHSLGGFLTQAFTARHSDVVSTAYTFNAPGVGTAELLAGYLEINRGQIPIFVQSA